MESSTDLMETYMTTIGTIVDSVIDTIASLEDEEREKKVWPERMFYPSQMSIDVGDGTAGACGRALYYEMKGQPRNIPDARSQKIFARGKMVESYYQRIMARNDLIKEMTNVDFKLLGTNIKFRDYKNHISGEFDAIYELDGIVYGMEIKTVGTNYHAISESITAWDAMPKIGAALQVLCYLDYTVGKTLRIISKQNMETGAMQQWLEECDPNLDDAFSIDTFTLLYWCANVEEKWYTLKLSDGGSLMIDSRTYSKINIADMHSKRKKLIEYIETNTLPPQDYSLGYPERDALDTKIKVVNRALSGIKRRKALTDEEHKDHKATCELLAEKEAELELLNKEYEALYEASNKKCFDFKQRSMKTWAQKGCDWRCISLYCSFRNICEKNINPFGENK